MFNKAIFFVLGLIVHASTWATCPQNPLDCPISWDVRLTAEFSNPRLTASASWENTVGLLGGQPVYAFATLSSQIPLTPDGNVDPLDGYLGLVIKPTIFDTRIPLGVEVPIRRIPEFIADPSGDKIPVRWIAGPVRFDFSFGHGDYSGAIGITLFHGDSWSFSSFSGLTPREGAPVIPPALDSVMFSLAVTPVPELESYAMFLVGLGVLGLVVRRRAWDD